MQILLRVGRCGSGPLPEVIKSYEAFGTVMRRITSSTTETLGQTIDHIKSMLVSSLRRGQSHSQIGASSFAQFPAANTVSAAGPSWASSAYPAAYADSGGGYTVTYPIRGAEAPSGRGLNTQAGEAEAEANSPVSLTGA